MMCTSINESGSVCWFSKVWPSGRVVFDVGLVCDIMSCQVCRCSEFTRHMVNIMMCTSINESGIVCWFSKVWPSGRVVFRCGVSLWYYVVRVVDAVNSPDTWWTSWCALRSMNSGSVCWFSKVWPSGRVVFRCGVSLWYYVVRVVDAVNSPDTWWTSWCALRSMNVVVYVDLVKCGPVVE